MQIDHLDKQTMDGAQQNLDALYQICPSCFTEAAGEDGKLRHVVDFEKLRALLGDNAVEDAPEVYDFTWVGKRAAQREAMAPCRKTLRPCPEESVNWDTTQNLYIEGDNLEVLKLLQNSYMGKVKMIYIDPPYNTGNDFVYHDDFHRTQREEDEAAGVINEEGERMVKNTESNGKFHSDWCSMIYMRLLVARNFLTEDGVIFISIDEHEVDNLRRICNEVFSECNHIGTLVLQTATDNNPGQIKMQHEYILCYAKNRNAQSNWAIDKESAKYIQEQYEELKSKLGNNPSEIQIELRKWIKDNSDLLKGITHYDNVDQKGVFHDGDIANTVFGGYEYNIIHPITGRVCKMPEKGYRFPWETMKEMLDNDEIMFGKDETTLPKPKIRLEEAKDLLRSVIYEDGRSSTKKFEALMARDIFQNPKSEKILSNLIEYVTKEGDIVMDFFSGSATFAESSFISQEKIGGLKFILVQYPENLDESMKTATSKAKKTLTNAIKFLDGIQKPHTIPEIGKERIRRAGKKIKEEHPEAKDLDIGFRVFKCDDSNYKEVAFAPKDYSQESLDLFVDNIKEDRTDLDLLFDCMLRWGVTLNLPMTKTRVDGCTIHNVNEGGLVACFDGKVTEAVIDAIAEMYPAKVVFRDSSFEEAAQKMNNPQEREQRELAHFAESKDCATKLNLFELFKQKCGWTEQEVKNNVRVI